MTKVKINNKTYNVKELTFRDYTKMEENGVPIIDAFKKKQIFLLSMGFVCCACDCDREEAEELIDQHILGGGNVIDIFESFSSAIEESDFFKRMLGMTTEKTKQKSQPNKEA